MSESPKSRDLDGPVLRTGSPTSRDIDGPVLKTGSPKSSPVPDKSGLSPRLSPSLMAKSFSSELPPPSPLVRTSSISTPISSLSIGLGKSPKYRTVRCKYKCGLEKEYMLVGDEEIHNIKKYREIVSLDVQFCDLYTFPILPPELEFLNISHNRIRELPRFITPHEKLRIIHINNNKITNLNINLSSFPNLQEITAKNNRIINVTYLPENIRTVNLEMNIIESITCTLPESLETLILSENKLRELPELNKNLVYLDVYNNKLEKSPIFNENLENLIITHNKLTKLDKSFENIKNLKNIQYDYFISFTRKQHEIVTSLTMAKIMAHNMHGFSGVFKKF